MNKTQSLSGYIRENLGSIEQRLEMGIRQEVIVAELKELGYITKVETLRDALWRARQWKKKKDGFVTTHAPQSDKVANPPREKQDSTDASGVEIAASSNTYGASVIPAKNQLEKRASKYIKGSVGEVSIDSLVNIKGK